MKKLTSLLAVAFALTSSAVFAAEESATEEHHHEHKMKKEKKHHEEAGSSMGKTGETSKGSEEGQSAGGTAQ